MTSFLMTEKTNWNRVCRLLTEAAKKVLMLYLHNILSRDGNVSLDNFLATNKSPLDRASTKGILHQRQMDIVYPANGFTDTDEWDITLVACVINNCIPNKTTLERSAINTITDLRNKLYGHAGKMEMTEEEFTKNWNETKDILTGASKDLAVSQHFSLLATVERIEKEQVVDGDELRKTIQAWKSCDIALVETIQHFGEEQKQMKSMVTEASRDTSETKTMVEESHNTMQTILSEVKGMKTILTGDNFQLVKRRKLEDTRKDESDASVNNMSTSQAQSPSESSENLDNVTPSKHESQDYLTAECIPDEQPDTSTGEISKLRPNLLEANIKPEVADTSKDNVTPQSEIDEDSDDEGLDSDDDGLDHDGNPTPKWREYQLELAEDALQGRNTIICAPTNSGKTWVALYIIQKHLEQATAGPKKIVYMAPTGNLVKQQLTRSNWLLPDAKTKLITSDDEDSKKVGLFLKDYDIIFLTPQILINNLENKSIDELSSLSMLVLDECHHTKKDEPYNNLMRLCLVEKEINPQDSLPQIVGLTASIGVGKSNTAEEACDYIVRMCARLNARCVSTVKRNHKQLEEKTVNTSDEVILMEPRSHDPCKDELMEAIEETERLLLVKASLQPVLTSLLFRIPDDKAGQEYQKWTIEVKTTAQELLQDAEMSRNVQSCAMYLNSYNAALEINSLLTTEHVARFLAEKHSNEEQHENINELEKKLLVKLKGVMMAIIGRKWENPNVGVVVQTLKTMLEEKGEDSRAMVFVKQRATCKALANILDKDFSAQGVRAGDLFGKERSGSEEGMNEATQNARIEKFRSGELKILVATSIGTEGIDIPDNNIVLSYNYSGNEITKTQMKGRIRKSGGTNVIMGSESLVERDKINAYKISLMHRGLKLFQELPLVVVERKVVLYQNEELAKYKLRRVVDAAKEKKRQPDKELEIQCIKCQEKVCKFSKVRRKDRHYIVIDPDIKDRVKMTPHKSPKKYDGLHKKFKMLCNNCGQDWGNVAESNGGVLCYTLQIRSLRFEKKRFCEPNKYKSWKEVPYTVPEINDVDLKMFLDHQ